MAVIKEWKCPHHGGFDSSHPICPAMGCDSADVTREFRTPPGRRSDSTARFDQGLRRTADGFNRSDLKSARAGESQAGNGASQMFWGADGVQKGMGISMGELVKSAAAPFTVETDQGKFVVPDGMRQAAGMGMTKRVLPPAEIVKPAKPDVLPQSAP